MKKLTATIIACGLIASGMLGAKAATMRLSADNGATWVTIDDNDPILDQDPTPGSILYIGPVSGWAVTVATGLGSPAVGTAITPRMDLGTANMATGPANLIVQMSDTNFIAFPNETFIASIIASTPGTVTYNTYRDSGNVLFGTTATSVTAASLLTEGPMTGTQQYASNAVVVPAGSGLYSLTLETVIVQNSGGFSSTDALLYNLPPPPCNCTLTYNSPTTITNCAGDSIADVTASQNCGAGSVSVPVTLTSITTNGTCPLLVTRNYTATDNCGNVHPFTQLVVINCKPDCTITPSVTTAMVGGSNYTAQVADAGSGAGYAWTVLNGTITAGQGTTKITWTAGTDTNSPISIIVTVTAPTGCQSTCSASVKLTPQPPKICLGKGDTATIGFWNNKNGQGIINGAANPPALADWLASNFPCLYSALAGKPNSTVAALFQADFGVKGAKTDAQVLAGALACYFTSTSLGGGSGPQKFGFNQSPGGTGDHTFNIGLNGTILGLQNNTSYTIMQLLKAASAAKCNPSVDQKALANVLNTIFDAINQGGDIS